MPARARRRIRCLLATDLADWLVRKGVPFRQAHHLVGRGCCAGGKAQDADHENSS